MADVKYVIKDADKDPGQAFDKAIEDYVRSGKLNKPLQLPDLDRVHITSLAEVVVYLKALKAAIVEGSRQANRLNKVVVHLTKVLVWLTGAMVILALISLYVLISSGR